MTRVWSGLAGLICCCLSSRERVFFYFIDIPIPGWLSNRIIGGGWGQWCPCCPDYIQGHTREEECSQPINIEHQSKIWTPTHSSLFYLVLFCTVNNNGKCQPAICGSYLEGFANRRSAPIGDICMVLHWVLQHQLLGKRREVPHCNVQFGARPQCGQGSTF